jgi:hypothetical protein
MTMASYVTMSLQDKISLLTQMERTQSLGQVTRQESGGRVITEFSTQNINLENEIQKLMDSIRNDPGFDSNNPLYNAIMAAQRPGQTRPIYISGFCGYQDA